MEYVLIICISIITLIILKFAWNIKIKDPKRLKELGYDKKLNEITNKLPENKKVCEEILKILGKEDVKIEESQTNQASLYMVLSNSIIIANIKNTFTRIQTIAHECLHSVQNKRTLVFNFVFSNIYIIYFITIIILTILKLNTYKMLCLFVLVILGFIQYAVRSYLEMDAMTKAKPLAKEYFEQDGSLNPIDQINILNNYEIINNIGIKLSNYNLILNQVVKIIIYMAICIVF